jgi:hypothetical protein
MSSLLTSTHTPTAAYLDLHHHHVIVVNHEQPPHQRR